MRDPQRVCLRPVEAIHGHAERTAVGGDVFRRDGSLPGFQMTEKRLAVVRAPRQCSQADARRHTGYSQALAQLRHGTNLVDGGRRLPGSDNRAHPRGYGNKIALRSVSSPDRCRPTKVKNEGARKASGEQRMRTWDTRVVFIEKRQRWWWNAWRQSTLMELYGFADSREEATRAMYQAIEQAERSSALDDPPTEYP